MGNSTKDKDSAGSSPSHKVSRRRFIAHSGATLSGALLLPAPLLQKEAGQSSSRSNESNPPLAHIRLTVNGIQYDLEVAHHLTLAEVLRDELGLTGAKIGCNRGECGACTVLLDGRAVYSCSLLAALLSGSKITTIEGLASGEQLHPLQQAFMDHDGLQCGFCTPGQIMAAKALLDINPSPTEAEVKRGLSGNLCRCACYNHIVAAVLDAATRLGKRG